MRRCGTILALASLWLHTAVALGPGLQAGAPAGTGWIPVCTAAGIEYRPAGGVPGQGETTDRSCPVCWSHCAAAALPAAPPILAAPRAPAGSEPLAPAEAPRSAAATGYSARGPPLPA